VYDKYLHEEQALELWDAQKDQFGRAESSVVVHKGRLGVGTTEPEGRFAVLDEPWDMEEFPPRAMTAAETYMEGHGVFRVSASSFIDISVIGGVFTQNIYPWYAFNKTSTYGWLSTSSVYSNGLADSDSDNRFGIRGEWLQIEMPSKIKLKHFTLSLNYDEVNPSGTNTSRFPKVFNLYKSNDGVTWTTAMEITTPTAPSEGAYGTTYTYNINESEYYNRYLIQVKQTHSNTSGYTNPSSHTAIGEWRLFGTREQGQSTLHDGSLTLTKNLTVPRIGPALDADDTPRRDRLVVEYNTSTNPTANGTVKDTSGRGNDGLFYGGASYDATEKALVFDGDVDYIQNLGLGQNLKGNQQLSASFWVKPASDKDNGFFQIGNYYGDSTNRAFAMRYDVGSSNYNIEISYADFENNGTTSAYRYNVPEFDDGGVGRWFHIVAINVAGTKTANGTTYDYGATTAIRLFLDGVELFTPSNTTYASAVSGTASDVLNLDPNPMLTIGSYPNYSEGQELTGSISNFKLYDVALTADEVKRLYDMGRLGNVIAQPVHIAAPLQVEKTLRVPIDSTAAGTTGMIRFNTSSNKLQVHTGTAWFDVGGTSATGGTVTYADGYTIHTFEESGVFTVYSGGEVEFLVVAGGGGGSNTLYCGGGGAGGMLTGTLDLPSGTYTITVGEGGATGENGADGSDSEFHTQLANGGGGGATYDVNGRDGGSGGGGGYATGNAGGGLGMLGGGGTAEQGNNGGRGNAVNGYGWGGGGGGAGAVGKTANSTTGQVGAGGNGLQSSITGTSTYYAGGGGGRVDSGGYDVPGGLGGGGDGNDNNGDGTAGAENTGGGGGPSKAGGSGIVIIRYLT
jgi:hypothetical protein